MMTFVFGIIVFFGNSYLVGASLHLASWSGSQSESVNDILSGAYLVHLGGIVLVIAGAVMFYVGKQEQPAEPARLS